MSLAPLIGAANVLWISIIAQAPVVRQALLGAGSVSRRGPLGIMILAAVLAFLIMATLGAVVAPVTVLARNTPRQTIIGDEIFAIIDKAQYADDAKLLSALAGPIVDIGEIPRSFDFQCSGLGCTRTEHVADELKRGVRLGGVIYASMLAFWLTGAFFYIVLLKTVRRKIARLERSMQETEESRHKMTTVTLRREEVKREFAQYGADRPASPLCTSLVQR